MINAFQGDFKSDVALSAIQFCSLGEKGAFINFLVTKPGLAAKPLFGTRAPFLDENQKIRGIGLNMLLLRAVQFMQCCNADDPTLFIQVVKGSDLHAHLWKIGFKNAFGPDIDLIRFNSGVHYVIDKKYVLLQAPEIVNPFGVNSLWTRQYYELGHYLPGQPAPGRNLSDNDTLAVFPFEVSGNYMDQAASQLLVLGHPFFYHHLPEKISLVLPDMKRFRKSVFTGRHIHLLDQNPSQGWLESEHINFLLQWIQRDPNNPLLKPFYVVPGDIMLMFRSFLDSKTTTEGFGRALHNYCSKQYRVLEKRFILCFENVTESHWIAHVYVNPFAVIAQLHNPGSEMEFQHGVINYDPLHEEPEAGSERQLLFLLNCLSHYSDIEAHGMLRKLDAPKTWKDIWTLGGRGPYGCYFEVDMQKELTTHIKEQGHFMPPLFVLGKKDVVKQSDSYNCGILSALFLMDFMGSQWKNRFSKEDLKDHIHKKDDERTRIRFPASYGLGTLYLCGNGENAVRLDSRLLGQLVRMEIVMLMERVHALYYSAYSKEDKFVPPSMGQLRGDYCELINNSEELQEMKKSMQEKQFPMQEDVRQALDIGKSWISKLNQPGNRSFNAAKTWLKDRQWESYGRNSKILKHWTSIVPEVVKSQEHMRRIRINNDEIWGRFEQKRVLYEENLAKLQKATPSKQKPESKTKDKSKSKKETGRTKPTPSATAKEKEGTKTKKGKKGAKAQPDETGKDKDDSAALKSKKKSPITVTAVDEDKDKEAETQKSKKAASKKAKDSTTETQPNTNPVTVTTVDEDTDKEAETQKSKKDTTDKTPKTSTEASEQKGNKKKSKKKPVLVESLKENEVEKAKPRKSKEDVEKKPSTTEETGKDTDEKVDTRKTEETPPKKKRKQRDLPIHDKVPASTDDKENTSTDDKENTTNPKKKRRIEESESDHGPDYKGESDSDGSFTGGSPSKKPAEISALIVPPGVKLVDDVELSDADSMVKEVDPALVKKKKRIPEFENFEPAKTIREKIRPQYYHPTQKLQTRSRKVMPKTYGNQVMTFADKKKKDWKMLEGEVFPRWVPKPPNVPVKYKNFIEKNKAEDYSLEGVPKWQQDEKEARALINHEIRREGTTTALTKMLSKFESNDSREAYKDWWEKAAHCVENEVVLTLWKNDLHLRFKPAMMGPKTREDGSIHGTYEAYVITGKGEEVVVEVALNWVQENVSKEAIAILHRVSDDWYTRFANKDGRIETGFLSLDDEKGTCKLDDDRQISMIRYLPEKRRMNIAGDVQVFKAKWRGLIKATEEDALDEFVWLDQEWMDENISKETQKFLKDTRKSGAMGYVRIPEGAAADHGDKYAILEEKYPDAPLLAYRRSGDIIDNDRSCVLKGAASCLSYLGYTRIAFLLCNDLKSGNKQQQGFEFFQSVLEPKNLLKNERRDFQFAKVKKNRLAAWSLFEETKNCVMCLVGLLSSDAKTDHAVAVAGNWIFDSNMERALPLSRESLDLCCSDAERKSTWLGVTRVSLLKRNNNL